MRHAHPAVERPAWTFRICPACHHPVRCYPVAYWRALAKRLFPRLSEPKES